MNARMEHDDVVEQDVANRYLTGRLAPDERAAFEEHFIDCPHCLDTLESADELQSGLRAVAAQDALNERIRPLPRVWRWRGPILAAAGAAAAIVIAVGAGDLVRTRRELSRMSAVADDLAGQADRAQSLVRSLSARVQQVESAPPAMVARSPASESSVPVFALSTVRGGATATPSNRVVLSGASTWIVLSLELDGSAVAGRYRATLRDAQQRERWRDDRLSASTPDMLGIALRATILDEGDFTLEVLRQPQDSTAWIPAGRYTFRIVKGR